MPLEESSDEANRGDGRSAGPDPVSAPARERGVGARGRGKLGRKPRVPQPFLAGPAAVERRLAPPPPAPPSQPPSPPAHQSPAPQPRPGWGGMMGGMFGGLLLGGLLGSLFFGGVPGGGIGLLEIQIIAGLAWLAISYMRRRQAPERSGYAMAAGYGSGGGGGGAAG